MRDPIAVTGGELEEMIDQQRLSVVLARLADICFHKASFLQSYWEEDELPG
jgi:hypothetical protein